MGCRLQRQRPVADSVVAHVRIPRDIAIAALMVTMSSTVSRQVRPLSPLSVGGSSGPPSLLSPPPVSGGALGRSDEDCAGVSFLAARAASGLRDSMGDMTHEWSALCDA